MLDQLRDSAKGWVSKLLMALLVLSFAVWGIGGFEGYGVGTLARVGEEEVSVQDFATAYDDAMRVAQQTGQQVNPDQVLSRLLLTAALDDEARSYNLGVSDDRVAAEIADNAIFQGPDGTFDRNRFDLALQNARINRDDFIENVRRTLVRQQIAQSITAGLKAPEPLVRTFFDQRSEERTISYVVIDDTVIRAPTLPDDSVLQPYFDERRDRFRAPEYRRVGLILLDPAAIADPAAVTEAEIAAEYEARRASLTRPERRRIEEARFPSADAASATFAAVEAGEDLATSVAANGGTLTDLGLKSAAELLDPAVAEAAFAAAENVPALVTEGAIEPTIVRVTAIEPAGATPLADVETRLRQDIALRNARGRVNDLYDQVEDERAGGATLEEAATALSLQYRLVENVSRNLEAPDGSAVADIPNARTVVDEAFRSDVGIEASPIRSGSDAWVFYEVLGITPERDRTFEEARPLLLQAWLEDEKNKLVEDLATDVEARLFRGESLEAVAAEVGVPVQRAEGVTRESSSGGLSANAVAQAFLGPQGAVANAEGFGEERIVLRVDAVTVPEYAPEGDAAAAVQTELTFALFSELMAIFNSQLMQNREVSVNNATYQQLTGQFQTQ
jgi:peptidyl-prolyl cis-trans isomerase D